MSEYSPVGYSVERQPFDMGSFRAINETDLYGRGQAEITDHGHRKLARAIDAIEHRFGQQLGPAAEAHIVRVGSASLPVVGFSERKLTDNDLHAIARSYGDFVTVIGEDNARQYEASIAVTPGSQIMPR